MSLDQNNTMLTRPDANRIIDAPGLLIDIPGLIEIIRNEEEWQKSDRNSITVFKTSGLCIVLGGLHKGAELSSDAAEGVMSLQVLEGLLEVSTDSVDTTLRVGQVVAINRGSAYSIAAAAEAIYLLTVSDVKQDDHRI